jgi:hypothetical protein
LNSRKDKQDKIKDIQQTGNVDYLANDFNCENYCWKTRFKWFRQIHFRLDAQKNMVAQMLSLAEMEKREALRLCQINTMKKIGTIKDNDRKVIAKSTQTTVCWN